MFYAYDSAFGGRGTTDAIKQPKPPQPKQPKPPKPPKSLARKPSKADSLNSTSSDTTGSVRSTKSVLSAFNFGFSRKPSKNQLHLKLPGLHRTNTLESQHDDAQRRPQTASAPTSNLRHARSASPLPITPSEPASAQVVHEVALSNNCVKARDSSIHSSESRPVSPGPSIVPSFENMRINGSRRSKATSVDSVDSTYRSLSPREPWGEDSSLIDMFPLTPDATTHNFPSIELPPTSPARRRTSGSDSAGSASVRSSTYSEDRFRPGGLPTIMDSEVLEPPRSPLPPVPPLQTLGKSPFQLVIERMEGAGLKMMQKRLSEDWGYPENEMDSIGEALFEQKLWSLMARQWLTQGKQFSSPAHEALLAESGEVKRILNLYGSIADGWVLAAKYPDSVVYTLMTNQDGHRDRGHSWPAPENHQVVFLPASDDFFPFPDNYFDAITSRTFSSAVRFKSWLSVFQECHRALKPQGWLEIHSLDAAPTRRGDLLNAWLDARLLCGIDESGLVAKPSERVLDYLEIAGFGELKKCKIALPVNVKSGGSGQELQDASKVMMYAGRHYYQELYSGFLRGRAPWWWGNRSIREECDKMGTMLGFIISFGQKEF